VLADVAPFLCCPVCGGDLRLDVREVRCPAGHTFDVARQGYVSLLTGARPHGSADTAAMVAARERFLGHGHYAPLADTVSGLAADSLAAASPGPPGGATPPLVVDTGVGTGRYLGAMLDRCPTAVGLGLDLSTYAVRRAARAHPRAGAAVCDVWGAWPVRSAAASVVVGVFAPRNAEESRRVLCPDGLLLLVTPARGHLAALVPRVGMLDVDPRKDERLATLLSPHFHRERREEVTVPLRLSRADVESLVMMGPSAHHLDVDEVTGRVAELDEPVDVTAAFTVSAYRPRHR